MKITRLFTVPAICFSLLLSGCGSLSPYGQDNAPKPSPLPKYQAALSLMPAWSIKTGAGNNDISSNLRPAFANNQIFVADQTGIVSAINPQTGQMNWQNKLKMPLTAGVTTSNNLIFVGSADGHLMALQQTDGKMQWQALAPDQMLVGPTIAKQSVLVSTIDGKLIAYNAQTGQQLWLYDHGAPVLILNGSSAPQINNDQVIVGYADGKLGVYSLDQGKLLWERLIASPQGNAEVQRMVDIVADPIIAGQVAYVATYQGQLAAINLANGQQIWAQPLSTYTGLALDNKAVYITDTTGNIQAFQRDNGQLLWQQKALTARILTAPTLVDNNTLAVADAEGYLHLLATSDGHFLGRVFVTKKGINTAPLVANNRIYVISRDGHLTAYQLTSLITAK